MTLLSRIPRARSFGGDVLTFRLIEVPPLVVARVGERRIVKGSRRWRSRLVGVRPLTA